jgi:hypothetical protein
LFNLLVLLQARGVLLVAPEHRLSLQHKWRELWEVEGQQGVCNELQALFGLPYWDILDESDELLHHRLVGQVPQQRVHRSCSC